jgi:hypothetical protein
MFDRNPDRDLPNQLHVVSTDDRRQPVLELGKIVPEERGTSVQDVRSFHAELAADEENVDVASDDANGGDLVWRPGGTMFTHPRNAQVGWLHIVVDNFILPGLRLVLKQHL